MIVVASYASATLPLANWSRIIINKLIVWLGRAEANVSRFPIDIPMISSITRASASRLLFITLIAFMIFIVYNEWFTESETRD